MSPTAPAVQLITPDWPVTEQVVALCSTRSGGCSQVPFDSFNLADHVQDNPRHVQENRRRLADRLGDGVSLQWLQQVHGTGVHRAASAGPPVRADAVITSVPGLACCVLTADCLPVFLASLDGATVGVAHAGWRGLAAGILEQTLAALAVPPVELAAWLGPAIGPCHFEVGGEVREAFLAGARGQLADELDAAFRPAHEADKYLADLYALARARLRQQGIGSIGGGGFCTFCDEQRFYSYRRSPRTGRMVSLIYRKE